nr:hypothetical protein [Tanacetum cinerariifolium]
MDSMISNGQKNTFAKYMILFGADNHPSMLDKDLYDSWQSRMELYMENRENGRIILESVKHGLFIWPTIEENSVTRTKKYVELSAAKKIQADCDVNATNIILQELPSDIYALVNHHGQHSTTYPSTPLVITYPSVPYPNAYSSIVPHDVCPPLHAIPQIEYPVSIVTQHNHYAKLLQMDSGLAVLILKQGDDPIKAINKMMSFLSTVITSRFPSSNNQLKTHPIQDNKQLFMMEG